MSNNGYFPSNQSPSSISTPSINPIHVGIAAATALSIILLISAGSYFYRRNHARKDARYARPDFGPWARHLHVQNECAYIAPNGTSYEEWLQGVLEQEQTRGPGRVERVLRRGESERGPPHRYENSLNDKMECMDESSTSSTSTAAVAVTPNSATAPMGLGLSVGSPRRISEGNVSFDELSTLQDTESAEDQKSNITTPWVKTASVKQLRPDNEESVLKAASSIPLPTTNDEL